MLRGRWLLAAALVLVACEVSSVPTPTGVTTTTEGTATTAAAATVPETTTTRSRPTTTRTTPPSTAAEPELCPGLPHPAHHRPCQPATVSTTPAPAAEPCAQALVGVRAVGLPAGFAFYCETAIMIRLTGRASAGLTGWNTSEGSFIAINPRTGNHSGVGAHESCHAQDFVTRGATSEASADACAGAHGHPNPYAGLDDVVVGEGRQERVEEWLVLAVLVGVLVLIVALLTLLPAIRRRLRNGHHRRDHP